MQTIQEAGVRGPGCAGRLTLSGWRGALARMIEARAVQTVLIALILVNAAVLGLETYPWAMAGFGAWLRVIDSVILSAYSGASSSQNRLALLPSGQPKLSLPLFSGPGMAAMVRSVPEKARKYGMAKP